MLGIQHAETAYLQVLGSIRSFQECILEEGRMGVESFEFLNRIQGVKVWSYWE